MCVCAVCAVRVYQQQQQQQKKEKIKIASHSPTSTYEDAVPTRTYDGFGVDAAQSTHTDHRPLLSPVPVPLSDTVNCVIAPFAVMLATLGATTLLLLVAPAVHVDDSSNRNARTLPVDAVASRPRPVTVTAVLVTLASTVGVKLDTTPVYYIFFFFDFCF